MGKLYTVATPRNIIGMADIVGPLTTPSEMKFNDVLEMVRLGYEIYQVNPYNYSEKIKVTISNINDIKFKSSISMALSQRKLNREIQEMGKPIVVETVKKVKETKKKETEENNQTTNDPEKIIKPDGFTK